MINSFKRVIRHILLYTLKYTPVARWVVQEACNRKVLRNPRSLEFIPDIFETQEMCNKAVEKHSCTLRFVSFQFWMHGMSNKAIEKYIYPMIFNTEEMCQNVVENDLYTLKFVPDHFNTEEICDKAVRDDPSSLQYVPDWFVTSEQIQMWYDKSEYCDNFFKWYNGYKKRKAQKASIKEELLPIARHPSRWRDWCMSEYKKKKNRKIVGINIGPFCV